MWPIPAIPRASIGFDTEVKKDPVEAFIFMNLRSGKHLIAHVWDGQKFADIDPGEFLQRLRIRHDVHEEAIKTQNRGKRV